MSKIWYFAGGNINYLKKFTNGKWFKISNELSSFFDEECDKFIKSKQKTSFINSNGRSYVMVKKDKKMTIWMLNQLLVRRVVFLRYKEGDTVKHELEKIGNTSVKFNEHVITKDAFVQKYKINFNVVN